MHMMMYISDYVGDYQDMPRDFRKILVAARTNNPLVGVTGVLFFDQHKFIQILEGEKEPLHELVDKIKLDPKHTNFKLLMDCEIARRELSDWNMKAFDLTGQAGKDWSILEDFRDVYQATFKPSSQQIIVWLQRFIKDYPSFKRIEH